MPALPDIVRTNAADTLALTEAIVMQGIAPLPRGLMYVSAAHTEDDIEATTLGIDAAIEALARKR